MAPPRRTLRLDESRSSEERLVINDAATSPLYVCEPHEIPPDVEYAWVRMTVRGYEDRANVQKRTRAGWTPVPASRHAAYSRGSLFPGMKSNEAEETIIQYDGLVLCEKSKRILQKERSARHRENMEIMESTPGLDAMPQGYVKANSQTMTQAGFQE
jgi:hypothetical protein